MNSLLLLVHMVTLLLPHRWTADALIVCPPDAQKVISYDTALLPTVGITATSEDLATNPAEQLFGRNNVPFNLWCTAPEAGIRHQINVSFTEEVVITGIVSSGFANGYVSEFAVEYSVTSPPGGLLLYKVFPVPEIDLVFSLQETPLTAQWLQLTILDGVIAPSGRLCWHLTLFGCRYSQAVQEEAGTTAIATVHPSTHAIPTPSPSMSAHSPTRPSHTALSSEPTSREQPTVMVTVTEVVRDYGVLTIAIPTAVCTVLLVLVIVTAGVLVCLRQGRGRNWKRSSREFSKIPSTETLRVLDNTTLYGKSSTPTIPPPLNLVPVLPQLPHQTHLQFGDALYENQLSPPPLNQEPHPYEAVTPTHCTAQRANSMVDNPTYNVPFYPPSPSLPPPPPPPDSPVKPPRIDLVSNECYSMSMSSESYANFDATEDLDYYSTGNIYETPQ